VCVKFKIFKKFNRGKKRIYAAEIVASRKKRKIQKLEQYHTCHKDIVQPKKRGVERGTIRTVLTSYTIADIF
jgi:hypothetical protein